MMRYPCCLLLTALLGTAPASPLAPQEKAIPDRLVFDAVVSADGNYYARSTPYGTAVYDLRTGQKYREPKGAAFSHLRISADARYLASGTPVELTLWDLAAGKPLATWKGKNRWSFKTDFSPDGTLLAAIDDESLRVWDVATRQELFKKPLPEEMNCVAFSPDGKLVAVAGAETREKEPRDHEIKIWEVPTGKFHASLKGPDYCIVRSMTFSPDGAKLATGLSVATVRAWDVRAKKEAWKQKVNTDYRLLAYAKDGKQLVVGGFEHLAVLDAASGAVVKTHKLLGSPVVNFVPGGPGQLLYAKKQVAEGFDLATGASRRLFPREAEQPDGKKDARLPQASGVTARGGEQKKDAKSEAAAKDFKKFAGTWEVVLFIANGTGMGADNRAMQVTFLGDRFKVTRNGKVEAEGTVKLDPTCLPKAIDVRQKGVTSFGIYQVKDNGELEICGPMDSDGPRPTEFSANPGSGRELMVLRRVKDKQ